MYNGKKLLALIPARGGSKGIKNKNIIELSDKPLIAYSIEAAMRSGFIDKTVVTTDSERIAEVSRQFGASVPFLRPAELAQDKSKTIDAVIHAIEVLKDLGDEFDVLVLLQPTQPLRTAKDIDGAIDTFFKSGTLPLASVSLVNDSPLLIRTLSAEGRLVPLLKVSSTCRRQDMPTYYRVNGCIYVNNIAGIDVETSLNDNLFPYIMPKERSIDIDEFADLKMAEYYLRLQSKK